MSCFKQNSVFGLSLEHAPNYSFCVLMRFKHPCAFFPEHCTQIPHESLSKKQTSATMNNNLESTKILHVATNFDIIWLPFRSFPKHVAQLLHKDTEMNCNGHPISHIATISINISWKDCCWNYWWKHMLWLLDMQRWIRFL